MSQTIEQQVQRLNRKIQRMADTELKRASSSALNKTTAKIRTRVVRGVSKETRIPGKHIRKRVHIRRSTARTQYARITVYRKDIPLISLGAAKTVMKGQGVADIARGKNGRFSQRQFRGNTAIRVGNKTYKDAFINRTKNGRWHIMRRKSGARYPVEVLKLPISQQVDRITPTVARQVMKADYGRLLRHELEYRARKLSGKL